MATDTNKDQTYFLYRVTGAALKKTLFPLGEYTKPTVRDMAKARGLFTAGKKDSQGICFVGKVGIREFLSQYVEQVPGEIIDKKSGKTLGHHDGAIFYTLGQRHGLDLGGGLPYYVVGKDMGKNEVYVTTDLNDETLWKDTVQLKAVHWINDAPAAGVYTIRIRHRATLTNADLSFDESRAKLTIHDQQRAIASGQSVVIYRDDVCLGGGIVL
jgi:tRNA-specific 2-thiouridylase